MVSADSYIDVRGRLQANDLFMHMLVDICANCESTTDLLVTLRLGASSSWYFDSYNNSVNAIKHYCICLISFHDSNYKTYMFAITITPLAL